MADTIILVIMVTDIVLSSVFHVIQSSIGYDSFKALSLFYNITN